MNHIQQGKFTVLKKSLFICALWITNTPIAQAMHLKNGTEANPQRVQAIWQVIKDLEHPTAMQLNVKEYNFLLKVCQACKRDKATSCKVQDYQQLYDWCGSHSDLSEIESLLTDDMKQKRVNAIAQAQVKFEKNTITQTGIIDKETQNIIISSFNGKFGLYKGLELNGSWPLSSHPQKSWNDTFYSYFFGKKQE